MVDDIELERSIGTPIDRLRGDPDGVLELLVPTELLGGGGE